MGEPVLVGRGMLADAVARAVRALRAGPDGLASAPEDVPLVIVCADGWDGRPYARVNKTCTAREVPWLPVRAELGRVVVGPLTRPGVPGCVSCAEERRLRAREEAAGHRAVMERHGLTLAERPSEWLTPLAAGVIAALVADEVHRTRSGRSPRTAGALLVVDLAGLEVVRRPFLPVPSCEECGRLPADSARRARLDLLARPKPAPAAHRVRQVRLADLKRVYLDEECGVVRRLHRGDDHGLAVSAATMGLRGARVESGFGRTRDYHSSGVTAVLEALERYGGTEPGGKRTVVTGSFAELREHAVDPRRFGLHPEESYSPGFPFRRFDERAGCRWVWAHSFARGGPVLVPEAFAYYGLRHADPDRPPFAYEISNGCALGGCLEEAILHGVLEVAERDAFLMTWYARLRPPRIRLASAADGTVPLLAEALEAETGYRVSAFDITAEHGVPSVWALAVNPDGRDRRPKAVCAAGSQLSLERAAENALRELGPALSDLLRRYPEQRGRAAAMVTDPGLVTGMPDHSLLYAHPAAFERLRFLTATRRSRELSGVPAAFRHADLRDDLAGLLARYLDSGLDVLVVDQTSAEHRAGGFACVKVLIPGLLPMTFGHDRRRTAGLPRLYRAVSPARVNPHPHPFP
ncbi:TOMM precursor leader peptide-binding protein [Nonomuraea sp. NPDC050328]|uniref:TOMM precursor leader peptide-binding protein n=1 Tax=Nonomuraea sp. NPDC050328 TaxID=3364361 RepID=UPI0037987D66